MEKVINYTELEEGDLLFQPINEKQMKQVKELHVYDFDGTLIDTVVPWEGRRHYRKVMKQEYPHREWWGSPYSLMEPFRELHQQGAAFESFHGSLKRFPKVYTVVMTGRISSLSEAVCSVVFDQFKLKPMRCIFKPQNYYLKAIPKGDHTNGTQNMGQTTYGEEGLKNDDILNGISKRMLAHTTLDYKLEKIERLANEFPNLKVIELWEDREEHALEFKKFIVSHDPTKWKSSIHFEKAVKVEPMEGGKREENTCYKKKNINLKVNLVQSGTSNDPRKKKRVLQNSNNFVDSSASNKNNKRRYHTGGSNIQQYNQKYMSYGYGYGYADKGYSNYYYQNSQYGYGYSNTNESYENENNYNENDTRNHLQSSHNTGSKTNSNYKRGYYKKKRTNQSENSSLPFKHNNTSNKNKRPE